MSEIFEPQLFSFHATCLHTRLTEFSLNRVSLHKTDRIVTESPLPALSCLLYHKCQQSDDCNCMRMFLRNLYKCKQFVYCVYCLRSSLHSCCRLFICLSAIFILYFVLACLFLCPLYF